jgi:hypothetical protein
VATALYAAALLDPGALRAQSDIGSMIAMPQEALATPGVLEQVMALGANAPRYPVDAPRHDELAGVAQ